jgi:hypothetical protein
MAGRRTFRILSDIKVIRPKYSNLHIVMIQCTQCVVVVVVVFVVIVLNVAVVVVVVVFVVVVVIKQFLHHILLLCVCRKTDGNYSVSNEHVHRTELFVSSC